MNIGTEANFSFPLDDAAGTCVSVPAAGNGPVIVLGPGLGGHLIRRFVRSGSLRLETLPLFCPPRPCTQGQARKLAASVGRSNGYAAVVLGSEIVKC